MIVKAIGVGLLSLPIGQIVGFIFLVSIGIIIELIAEKLISDIYSMRRFRHLLCYAFLGMGIGMMNATGAYFFNFRSWIPAIIFIIYLVVFIPYRKTLIFTDICEENEVGFKRLLRHTELITFISYIIGLYGLWTIFMKS